MSNKYLGAMYFSSGEQALAVRDQFDAKFAVLFGNARAGRHTIF